MCKTLTMLAFVATTAAFGDIHHGGIEEVTERRSGSSQWSYGMSSAYANAAAWGSYYGSHGDHCTQCLWLENYILEQAAAEAEAACASLYDWWWNYPYWTCLENENEQNDAESQAWSQWTNYNCDQCVCPMFGMHPGSNVYDGASKRCQSCFPADAAVLVLSDSSKISTKSMSQLKVGDRVQTASAAGELVFEPIFFFGHRNNEIFSDFVDVTSESGETLSLTKNHYLHVVSDEHARPGCSTANPSMACTRTLPASWVRAGDVVFTTEGDVLKPSRVANVNQSTKQGIFNPYTVGGSIVVDGTLASSHSDWVLEPMTPTSLHPYLPAMYQLMFAPVRFIFSLLPDALETADHAALSHNPYGWTGMSMLDTIMVAFDSVSRALSAEECIA